MRDPTAELADENLYARNAFRVTGLATSAGADAIRDRRRTLEAGTGSVVPGPGVRPEHLAAAFEVLAEPRLRIAHELFWLWGQDVGDCGCDDEIHVLHDRAVLAHTEAIDATLGRRGAPEAWALAASSWNRLVPDPRTWDHLAARVRALDERQLGVGVVDHLHIETPRLLVIAGVRAALAGRGDERSMVLNAPGWGADRSLVEAAVSDAVGPVVTRLDELLVEARTATHDGGAEEAGLELRESALPEVRRLTAVAPPARYQQIRDLVDRTATALNDAGSVLGDSGDLDDGDLALELLRDALAIAPSPTVRATIEQNRSGIQRVLQANRLLAPHGLSVATTNTDDLVARITAARRRRRTDEASDLIDALLALLPADDPDRPTLRRVRDDVAAGRPGPGRTPLQDWAPALLIPYGAVLVLLGPQLPGWLIVVLLLVGVAVVFALRSGYLPRRRVPGSGTPEGDAERAARRGLRDRLRPQIPRSDIVGLIVVGLVVLTFQFFLWTAAVDEREMSVTEAVVIGSVCGLATITMLGFLVFGRSR